MSHNTITTALAVHERPPDNPFAEPRVECPTCGAHVFRESAAHRRTYLLCPVCEYRWGQAEASCGSDTTTVRLTVTIEVGEPTTKDD